MATPGSGSTETAAQSPSASHIIIPAPIATNEQHVCFICLQNDTDTPDATWVNACPCSLEAHEECMLSWIADMETSPGRSKGGFKCPVCKAPITVEEPYDRLLAIQGRLYRRYSSVSPYILTLLGFGGTFAGLAWYGFGAAAIFVGRNSVLRWLEVWRFPSPSGIIKLCFLAAVGPGLVILRWLPSLGTVLLLPISAVYGASLVAHDNLPTWPPSPQWAMTLMPLVQLSYAYLFHDLFGPLERRLNRALRGLPPTEDNAPPAAGAAVAAVAAVAAPEPAAGAGAARNEAEADGLWGTVANLGRAVLGLFLDWPAGGQDGGGVEFAEEFEFMIGGRGNAQGEHEAGQALAQGEEDMAEGDDEFQVLVEAAVMQLENGQEPEEPQPPAAEQPEPQAAQQNQLPRQNQNDQRPNNNNNNAAALGETSYFSLIVNSIVTSLLFPVISYTMGELIGAVVPRSWGGRMWRRSRGLLQVQWGRSLAGGCLYVVLRDAIALYSKYRRVQVRAKRRVKNVERRPERGATAGTGQ
ncbi:hypothetical protein C8A00DRAFT_35540 [Chaetomidium leptoderma]|uniref:RING-CH-type domain-containing protein n=1 Tax=Chaetomidium leptoderma TaxID=669021 RepID=A0AAN6ZVM6_9PEZI|nr:hypothetical protein C8A00DRAFT_35540 [Chaetomidium leptoderma]